MSCSTERFASRTMSRCASSAPRRPSTSENGTLRVVPSSHKAGVLSDENVLDYVRAHRQVECTVPKGGALAMRPLLIHASSKAQTLSPRRVLHIEYADSLVLDEGILLAI